MTVLTVKAQDTATAMEEIVEKLGKDSFIIETKKIGDEILVKATNSPKKTSHSKQNLNKTFNKMISKELNQSSVSSLGNKSPYGIDDKGEKFSINNFGEKALKEFRAEFRVARRNDKSKDKQLVIYLTSRNPEIPNTSKYIQMHPKTSSCVLQ